MSDKSSGVGSNRVSIEAHVRARKQRLEIAKDDEALALATLWRYRSKRLITWGKWLQKVALIDLSEMTK